MVSTRTVEVDTFSSGEDFWQKLIDFSTDFCPHVNPRELLLAVLSQADNIIVSNEASGFIKQNLAILRLAEDDADYNDLKEIILFLDIIAQALPACFFTLIIQEIMARRARIAAVLQLTEDLSQGVKSRDQVLPPGIEPGFSA